LAQDDVVIIGPYRVLRLLAEGDKVKAKILKAEELEKQQKSGEVEVHVS
jgi:hypothetical protein